MAGFKVSIGADSSKAEKELSSFEKKTHKIAKSIAKGFKERIGHKLFDGLTSAARAVPGVLTDAVKSASSLNEQIGKSEAVFGDSADAMKKWSKGTADAIGMARVESLEAAGTFGTFFNALKFSDSEAADMSRTLVELAADMGSFSEATNEETITALFAALRGQQEPIQRLGVSFNAAELQTKAFQMGLVDAKGALDAKTKAMVIYQTILEQTERQQGNFSDTSEGLANSTKILEAKFKDASSTIGEQLLPFIKELVNFMKQADWKAIGQSIGSIAEKFVYLTSSIGDAYDIAKELLSLDFSTFGKAFDNIIDNISGVKTEQDPIKKIELSREEFEELKGRDFETIGEFKARKARERASLTPKEEAESTPQSFGNISAKMKSSGTQEAIRSSLMQALSETQSGLDSLSSQSGNQAISSMQRIGGGGGVAFGALDMQKKQTELQGKMVELLKALDEKQPVNQISDY